ncbi:MAG TPA: serine/threonine-protein kinase, partial [Pseudonocardia sp.]|nr:serine/threonine-protein kinase [Pseudonocardia sp.]
LARRRIGSRYGAPESVVLVAAGVLTAGLLPLAAFTAVGRVFADAAAGGGAYLTSAQLDDLAQAVCFAGPQAGYLGGFTVGEAFDTGAGRPLRFGMALLALGLLPLLAALFTAVQARLALRRGPSWPAKFFWIPVLALAFLTAEAPAGSSGHLWLGVVVGGLFGMPLVLAVGAPSRDTVRRSLEPRPSPPRRLPPPPKPAPPQPAPARSAPAGPEPARPDPRGSFAGRLAERFAARNPEPPVVVDEPARSAQPAPPGPPGGRSATRVADVRPLTETRVGLPPTLVASGSAAAGAAGAARFRLIRRLGSGGFGRVWLAHDARLGHEVAVKAAHAPDDETEQRIQREAAALGAVRHPNCVRIYDLVHATDDPGLAELDGLVIVMEYMHGSSLGELVRGRGVLDDVAAARVWAAMAGALAAAHARGVLHRDVKPANIVVDPTGLAHLIDFGIARRSGDSTLTATGFVLGTPDFLAPEVATGGRATPASDAWQLAATISYALTGQPPRGRHEDAVSGLRAAAAGAALTHLPQRSAHVGLLRAAMDTEPGRRPPLAAVERAMQDWLRRSGAAPDGPVTATMPGR